MILTEKCVDCNKAITIEILDVDAENFLQDKIFIDIVKCDNCGKENRVIAQCDIMIDVRE